MKALRMLHEEHGLSISPRRVTLLHRRHRAGPRAAGQGTAHAEPRDLAACDHREQRTALVPPNRKYSLASLLETCRKFPLKKRARITFEYVLLSA
jgi:23S rRNA (adenine2503-C2)-methyltransferase